MIYMIMSWANGLGLEGDDELNLDNVMAGYV